MIAQASRLHVATHTKGKFLTEVKLGTFFN